MRDHSSITSSKRWVGGVRKWQFLIIYSTVNHQRGRWMGLRKSKTWWRNTCMVPYETVCLSKICLEIKVNQSHKIKFIVGNNFYRITSTPSSFATEVKIIYNHDISRKRKGLFFSFFRWDAWYTCAAAFLCKNIQRFKKEPSQAEAELLWGTGKEKCWNMTYEESLA